MAQATTAASKRPLARLWAPVAIALLLQVVLLVLAGLLVDLFAHDLLCRYGQTRWDPSDRKCWAVPPVER